ncbi:MAG: redoxin domain-containing protein [Candidatus Eisenbacteria bacterium]|nr:redoxin domain-containing protein [Candidatus Eisenbacteria bacterium]
MKSPATMLAVVLLAATSLDASDGDHRHHAVFDNSHPSTTLGPVQPDPPIATLEIGEAAPDFSFEGHDHVWRRLRDLLGEGSVLLVFAPDDARMKTLESERTALLGCGIVPVVVLDRRDGATWSTMQRLHLNYSLLSDPQSVIGSQFNVRDPASGRCAPSWFMVDRSGRVRGLSRERLPQGDFVALARRALGLPGDDVSLPASNR